MTDLTASLRSLSASWQNIRNVVGAKENIALWEAVANEGTLATSKHFAQFAVWNQTLLHVGFIPEHLVGRPLT